MQDIRRGGRKAAVGVLSAGENTGSLIGVKLGHRASSPAFACPRARSTTARDRRERTGSQEHGCPLEARQGRREWGGFKEQGCLLLSLRSHAPSCHFAVHLFALSAASDHQQLLERKRYRQNSPVLLLHLNTPPPAPLLSCCSADPPSSAILFLSTKRATLLARLDPRHDPNTVQLEKGASSLLPSPRCLTRTEPPGS